MVVMVYYCLLLDMNVNKVMDRERVEGTGAARQTDGRTAVHQLEADQPTISLFPSSKGFFRTLTMISAPPPDVLEELGSSPLSPTTAAATTTLHASSHTAQYSSKIPERAGHALLAVPVYHTEKRNGSKYKIF